MLVLFLYSNVVKFYREVKVRKLIYFNDLFSHLSNKW